MNLTVDAGEKRLTLSKAFLVYNQDGKSNNEQESCHFASVHDVQFDSNDLSATPRIMPGSPLTIEAMRTALLTLGQKHLSCIELLPENVLAASTEHLLWWLPASKRRVFFNCEELGKRAAVVPHPPLLFSVAKNKWAVFALKKNARPTKETKLFRAPYFNVYDSGLICVGSAKVPSVLSTESLGDWESAFFDSEFNHTNGSLKRTKHPNGDYGFWKLMLDKKYTTFPMELLVPQKKTVGDQLAEIQSILRG